MQEDDRTRSQSSKPRTVAPSVGGGVSGPIPDKLPPQTDKAIPIGTPLTLEQLRRLKREAEQPDTATQVDPKKTKKDSS
jgi:hypothetical protein